MVVVWGYMIWGPFALARFSTLYSYYYYFYFYFFLRKCISIETSQTYFFFMCAKCWKFFNIEKWSEVLLNICTNAGKLVLAVLCPCWLVLFAFVHIDVNICFSLFCTEQLTLFFLLPQKQWKKNDFHAVSVWTVWQWLRKN